MSLVSREKIFQLTSGIRYEKSFRISDIIGHIFDVVLHDKSTPFGTDFFPRYEEIGSQDRWLLNAEKGYYMRLTTSDLIFQYTLHSSLEGQEKEINWFIKDALQFIIDKIFHETRIINIMRFGFMITHLIEGENLGGNVLNQLTSGEIKNADQFTIRFGNKDLTADGLIKKGVNDFVNRLTTIKQIGETKYDVTLDYQYHFLPELKDLEEWPIQNFFDRAFSHLDNKFYSMINPLVNKMVKVA